MARNVANPSPNASTTSGSKCVPRSPAITSRACSNGIGALYTRREISASNTSATAISRAATGIASPARPSGYPVPSHRSWWCRAISLAKARKGTGRSASRSACSIASAPSLACVFMTSHSAGVSLPGLSRMWSGMPTLPMSCSGADFAISAIVPGSSARTKRGWARSMAASARTYSCVRRMWLPVSGSRISARRASAWMLTSCASWLSRIRRTISASR